ncbi:hypothetical protein ACP70R_019291 [Stipagrostis hirtigluma subsp. patula]
MPASSRTAGDGAPWRSASAIVAGAVTGYHVLKIVGYSRTKDVPNGKGIKARPFLVGGRKWHLEYLPNGNDAECTDSISMFLHLDDNVAEAVKADAKFSLLDQDGNPVPSYSFTTGVVNFSEKRNWGYHSFIKRRVLEKSEHLKDDSFTVRVDVTVIKDVCTEATPFVVVPPPDMNQQFGDLLLSKERADVEFQVGTRTFSAHRLVLATRSPVFKAELYGSMKESNTMDAIRIDGMEADVFDALLTFMYTDTLPEMKKKEESAMAQHLLVAADRYNLERLKLICEDKLCKYIDKGSAASILTLAEQHNCRLLRVACLQFLRHSKNLDMVMETDDIEYLTSSCPSVMKKLESKPPRLFLSNLKKRIKGMRMRFLSWNLPCRN